MTKTKIINWILIGIILLSATMSSVLALDTTNIQLQLLSNSTYSENTGIEGTIYNYTTWGGSNDEIKFNQYPNPLTTDFSVSVRFNSSAASNSEILHVDDSGSGAIDIFMLSTGEISAEVIQSSGTRPYSVTTNTVNDGNFHQLTINFNSTSDTIDIFIDGVEASYSTQQGGGPPHPITSATAHMGLYSSGIRDLVGSMYNFIITTDQLTLSEIQDLNDSTSTQDNLDNVIYYNDLNQFSDKSGNTNNIIANSGIISNPGNYSFDGTNDYVNVPINPNTVYSGSLWVKPETFAALEMFTAIRSGATREMYLGHNGVNSVELLFYDGGTTTKGSITGTVNDSDWNHVAFSRNGDNIELWVNGISQGTDSTAGKGNTGLDFVIGRNGDDSIQYYNDYLQNYIIFNSTINVTIAIEIYNAGKDKNWFAEAAPPVTSTFLTLSNLQPTASSQFNVSTININATINSSSNFTCDLTLFDLELINSTDALITPSAENLTAAFDEWIDGDIDTKSNIESGTAIYSLNYTVGLADQYLYLKYHQGSSISPTITQENISLSNCSILKDYEIEMNFTSKVMNIMCGEEILHTNTFPDVCAGGCSNQIYEIAVIDSTGYSSRDLTYSGTNLTTSINFNVSYTANRQSFQTYAINCSNLDNLTANSTNISFYVDIKPPTFVTTLDSNNTNETIEMDLTVNITDKYPWSINIVNSCGDNNTNTSIPPSYSTTLNLDNCGYGQQSINITVCDGPSGSDLNCITNEYTYNKRNRFDIRAFEAVGGAAITNFTITVNGTGISGSTTNGLFQVENLLNGSTYNFSIDAPGFEILTVGLQSNATVQSYNFTLQITNSFNITFYDSDTRAIINDRNITIQFIGPTSQTNTTDNGTLFLNGFLAGNYTLIYDASEYQQGKYVVHFSDRTHRSLSLYMQTSNNSQLVLLRVEDRFGNRIPNVEVIIQRYANDSWVTDQIYETDFQGQAEAYYVLSTVFYNHLLVIDGETVQGDINQDATKKLIYSEDVTNGILFIVDLLGSGALGEYYQLFDVGTSLTVSNTTNNETFFRFAFNQVNNLDATGTLRVEYYGNGSVVPGCDNVTTTTSSGIITCNVGKTENSTVSYVAKGYVDGVQVQEFLINRFDFSREVDWGATGYIFGFFILVIAAFVFSQIPAFSVIASTFAFTVLAGMGIVFKDVNFGYFIVFLFISWLIARIPSRSGVEA